MTPQNRKTGSDPGSILRQAAREGAHDAGDVAARFTAMADAEDLLDVAYATVDSPFGPLILAGTPRGLVRLAFQQESMDAVLDELASKISPRVLEAPARLDSVRRELDLYFEGRLHEFGLALDWQLTQGFRRRVLRATARVPFGKTSTYSRVAAKAGSPRAYRAAGSALGSNPLPIVVPCHRILHSSGGLGGYGGGLEMKRQLLELEGAREQSAFRL